MLDRFFALISDLTEAPHEAFGDDDYRLAAAALLVHVMAVDGRVSASERERIQTVLEAGFALSRGDTGRLIERAVDAEASADSWTSFADLLAKRLDEDGRRRIVDMMWSVVLADGAAAELEEAVVERAAALMGVEVPMR
ncbi:MAG: TerB family tellurite resistance protein [Phreatobacter sp.]|uniref:tellurite resistance TerB family protein n=1 Tax=Phreatobacter sp. TaxID=1966341 RepID=UPI002735D49F|nr:TerB family tellurite resistance protein [Phreatobacter sp.]MDP2804275.1 TerB family tellurite resistance protein [Phreatobacter sp.]